MIALFNKYYNYLFVCFSTIFNIFPKRIRPIVLLLISFLFFYFMSSKLIICLLLTIISVYFSTLLIDKLEKKKKLLIKGKSSEEKKTIKTKYQRFKRLVLIACIIFNVGFLFIFKYLNFFTININYILELLRFEHQFSVLQLIAPIGISFYTMEALSYLFDVYTGKIEADKNIIKVALFLSFFPQIIEGPMARFSDTADDLYKCSDITYQNFCLGFQRFVWGVFKKIVIANRLNPFVNTIFDNYGVFSGPMCFIGALGYTVLLYMEFSGTMDMVVGIGKIFDVKIPENFRQPFFSKNISEFWTRWHISLGAWFRDYIYYPISLSKPMRKLTVNARKVVGNHFGPLISSTIALFAVWALNGLWHGAGWTFILFGMYHFILIFLGNLFEPFIQGIFNKFKWNRDNLGYRIFRSIKTTFFVIFGELIFRAPTVTIAFTMIKKIFTDFSLKISEFTVIGIDIADYLILFISIIIIFIISILKERKVDVLERINSLPVVVRWILFYALAFYIVIFGAYGPGYHPVDPMYADF